jgi:hypothetical protein
MTQIRHKKDKFYRVSHDTNATQVRHKRDTSATHVRNKRNTRGMQELGVVSILTGLIR